MAIPWRVKLAGTDTLVAATRSVNASMMLTR
jgi:hypothetical protein